ncbi:MAG: alcohol dehydrogenase catalytic domain-containing protein [Anaerolineae bacterium]|nr:alcohol dehydrogenase catalytic domain-containing protein [Anaerolineae bacterium]
MRALIYDETLHLDRAHDEPTLQGDQVLLKITRAGICNTDLELVAGMYGFTGVLGHEFVAEVAEGPKEWLGKRVVGEINVACTECDFCRRGIPSQCRHRTTVGIDRHPGAFADYLALTSRNIHAVPDSVSDDQAVFVEPLAAALQVTKSVHISPHDRVVVLGVGKLGMLVAQVLKLLGADIVAVVRRNKQAALLNQWKIPAVSFDELEPEHAQVVVDCSGQASGFSDALHLVEPRGTLVLKSTYNGLPQADLTQIAVREIRVIGSRCGPFEAALRLLESSLVDVESLIDMRYSLDDAIKAFDHARQPGVLKVLFDY